MYNRASQVDADRLVEALRTGDWYVAAAVAIGAVVFLWQRLAPSLWKRIPERWRWAVPVALGAMYGFLRAFDEDDPPAVALVRAAVAAVTAGLAAAGGHHALSDMPIRYGEKKKALPITRENGTFPP